MAKTQIKHHEGHESEFQPSYFSRNRGEEQIRAKSINWMPLGNDMIIIQ